MSFGNPTFTTRDCYHICFSQASCMGDLLSLIQSMISTILMETNCKKKATLGPYQKKRSANMGKHRQTAKATPATRKNPEESCREEVSELRPKLEQLQLQRVKAQQANSWGKFFCWHLGNVGVRNMTLMMPFLIQERRLLARHMLPAA